MFAQKSKLAYICSIKSINGISSLYILSSREVSEQRIVNNSWFGRFRQKS